MNNPFLRALRTNPKQFLDKMETPELVALAEGCVEKLVDQAGKGDRDAMLALQQVYRVIGEVEI